MEKRVFGLQLFIVFACFLSCVYAHSWVQCADYTEENGRIWDEKKCRGWPRDFVTKFASNKAFGADVGMNYNPSETQPCQTPSNTASSYSSNYPAASYAPGQRVCMAWPPKNHVAADCGNKNIPDAGTKIYRSNVNPTSDPTLSEFKQNLIADLGTNTQAGAGVGFQNCPNFCADNDKSLCTGCFDVPSNLPEGKYVFLWEWAFNGPNDLYATCSDVTISKSVKNDQPTLYSHEGPDAYASGGGQTTVVTSGGQAKGSSGSGSSSSGGPQTPTTYSPGSIAAAVILTFLAVTAIFVGLIWTARKYPHSPVGSALHRFIEPQANPRREGLLS